MPYIMTLVSLFATDSFIKSYIEANKEFGEETPLFDGKVIVKKVHNKGAALNLGEQKQQFVAALSLVFSAFVSGMFAAVMGRKGKRLLKTGLALILGGAFSNTYDRLKYGYVVDYFSFCLQSERQEEKADRKKKGSAVRDGLAKKFSTVVFNLSDLGIIAGSVLLVASELTGTEKNG